MFWCLRSLENLAAAQPHLPPTTAQPIQAMLHCRQQCLVIEDDGPTCAATRPYRNAGAATYPWQAAHHRHWERRLAQGMAPQPGC